MAASGGHERSITLRRGDGDGQARRFGFARDGRDRVAAIAIGIGRAVILVECKARPALRVDQPCDLVALAFAAGLGRALTGLATRTPRVIDLLTVGAAGRFRGAADFTTGSVFA